MTNPAHHPERGSVLVYVLIAIVVFAALSFAMSHGSRESVTTADRERADLEATQILDYTGAVRRALQTMRINGVRDSEICFHHSGWGSNSYDHAGCAASSNQVFNIAGGGVNFSNPPDSLLDRQFVTSPGWGKWHFTGNNRIAGVGENCNDGNCNELLIVLPYLRETACAALNRRLQVSTTDMPSGPAGFSIAAFNGTFNTGGVVNDPILERKRTGCFKADTSPADGAYVFFSVLVAQ